MTDEAKGDISTDAYLILNIQSCRLQLASGAISEHVQRGSRNDRTAHTNPLQKQT